jgi:hypothetical protein
MNRLMPIRMRWHLTFAMMFETMTLKEYHFTDEQIDFILQLVRDNAQYEEDDDRDWMNELANQIEDQIVNHPTND